MPAPIVPWESQNIPEEIASELDRRKTNRSFLYTPADEGGWEEKDGVPGDWRKYRGPMSPWVRFCSNGLGRIYQTDKNGNFVLDEKTNKPKPLNSSEIKSGFVLFGGKDFYSGYGFTRPEGGTSIIGYTPDKYNTPHTIDNDLNTSNYPIYVPAPEIEKINVTIQQELFRRASIEWVCFSKKQLEYMTPYFLVPGISCILEWGWNHYNPSSLLDLSDTTDLMDKFNNPYPLYTENILLSKGNYDIIFGIITHFEWFVEGNKIRCKTEITSKDRIYAGILSNSNVISNSSSTKKTESDKDSAPKALDNLMKFFSESLPSIKNISSTTTDPEESAPLLKGFIQYLKDKYKKDDRWKEYLYGIFYGRDSQDKKSNITNIQVVGGIAPIPFNSTTTTTTTSDLQQNMNIDKDFDNVNGKKELWINLGLAIEAINFHTSPLRGMKGKEMFRIDVDNVVIGAHPNMISSDGNVLLIPNYESPKYFYGDWGNPTKDSESKEYKEKLGYSTKMIPLSEALKNKQLADIRFNRICLSLDNKIYRDDLDDVINHIRYENQPSSPVSYEFPFSYDRDIIPGSKPYPARYSGYLKDLYVNVIFLVKQLQREDVKTYTQFIEKVLLGISSACGNFWDFRLVNATGENNKIDTTLKKGEDKVATMKIVDYKFMASLNTGKVYTFDYYDADSLFLGMGFKPTISNAQAIRSLYAPTNNPNRNDILINGENELLDYHFKDRLFSSSESDVTEVTRRSTAGYQSRITELQQLVPYSNGDSKSYQVTSLYKGKTLYRRLVLPDSNIVQMLLDDGDEEHNPKYTGIMPNIQANFTIQGVGGLRTFMMFLVRNLPEPYSHLNIIFRIVDVQEAIENGKWTTVITAGVIPLRDWVKTRLGINIK